jgi:SAM-dependent methyltransferase
MSDVHPAATKGYSRGASTYVRGRPDFPPAALDWLHRDPGLQPGRSVVDLGAGTGKFTRLPVETGATVAAVEPVTAMLERLARDLSSIAALRGNAQHIPLPDSSAGGVLDDATRTRVPDQVRALIDVTPELAGRTGVSFPYVTRAYSLFKE